MTLLEHFISEKRKAKRIKNPVRGALRFQKAVNNSAVVGLKRKHVKQTAFRAIECSRLQKLSNASTAMK
jgi:hypothetical protein